MARVLISSPSSFFGSPLLKPSSSSRHVAGGGGGSLQFRNKHLVRFSLNELPPLHGSVDIGAILTRAETLLYTVADAAVVGGAADSAVSTDPAVQKSGGWFGFISDGMELVLKFLKDGLTAVHVPYAYGFAIILLTIIVKAATYPLTKQQVESTMAMQNLQPKIKAIQQRYAGNQERIQLETRSHIFLRNTKMIRFTVLSLSVFLCFLLLCTEASAKSAKYDKPDEADENDDLAAVPSCCGFSAPLLIKKDQWQPIFSTKFGQISTVQIGDGCGGMGPYKIHSITLEPNALLLPLLLHSDMVFFVDSGSGILNWVEQEATSTEIRLGDVYRLRPGTVFYLQSKPVDIFLGTKLRIYAIFSNTQECLHDPCFGAYSSVTDLLFGFDETILKSAFGVPEEIIGLMRNRTQPPLIVHDMLTTPGEANTNTWPLQTRLLKLFSGSAEDSVENKKKEKEKEKKEKKKKKPKKATTFNVFESQPDFQSPNGQTITINRKDLKVLQGSMVGVSMVNLTQGSMMGPHWNPWACEISVVVRGSGMVRVLRNSISRSSAECKNMRFKVEKGDIFAVPRLHPMTQMSFLNDSLVFVGFTTSAKNNEPQFLAGKNSALWSLDREVLAATFNVSNFMIAGLLEAQKEAVVLGCPACAEGELERLKEEQEEKKPSWPPQQPPTPFQPQPPEEKPQQPPTPFQPQPPQEKPEEQPQPFQPQPGQGEPQGPQASMEAKMRDEERKREEEEAKKDEEERWKQEEKLWPPQPQWEA